VSGDSPYWNPKLETNEPAIEGAYAPPKLFQVTAVSLHGAVTRCTLIVSPLAKFTKTVSVAELIVEPGGMFPTCADACEPSRNAPATRPSADWERSLICELAFM